MKSPRLASMPLDALLDLRDKVEKAIHKHVAKQRKHYEGQLAHLASYGSRGTPAKASPVAKRAYKKRRGKAAIKYRGAKAGERWSGRGLTPRWLTAYIKAGKKKESFLVGPKKAKRSQR